MTIPHAEFVFIDRPDEPKHIDFMLRINRIPGNAIQYRSSVPLDDRSPIQAMEDALTKAAAVFREYQENGTL
jgi:hypothetical protein